jgi:hypothetical protein
MAGKIPRRPRRLRWPRSLLRAEIWGTGLGDKKCALGGHGGHGGCGELGGAEQRGWAEAVEGSEATEGNTYMKSLPSPLRGLLHLRGL